MMNIFNLHKTDYILNDILFISISLLLIIYCLSIVFLLICYLKTRQTIDFQKIIKRTICHYMRYDRNRHAHKFILCHFLSLPDIKSPSFRICPHLPLIFTLCDLLFLKTSKNGIFGAFFSKSQKSFYIIFSKPRKSARHSTRMSKTMIFQNF